MTFSESASFCLKNYTNFNGRAPRSEFWWFYLFCIVVGIAASILDVVLFGSSDGLLSALTSVALLLPFLAVGARRLHDAGRSAWWLLLLLTVIGVLVLLYWWTVPGDAGDNVYGPAPQTGVAPV